MLMWPLPLCRYACWERRLTPNSSCCGSFCFHFYRRVSHFHCGCYLPLTTTNMEMQPSLGGLRRKQVTHASFLPVTPLASSSTIACQSGLILDWKLMAPDKCFTSGHRRECAMVNWTTQHVQHFIPPPSWPG